MVKRKGHFMEKLCTIDNMNLADDNARMNKVKSKKGYSEVLILQGISSDYNKKR